MIVVAVLATWGYAAYAWIRAQSSGWGPQRDAFKKRFLIALVLFAAIIVSQILPMEVTIEAASAEVIAALKGEILSVDVNGRPLRDFERLVTDLRQLDTSTYRHHHSHPVKPEYSILLHTVKGQLRLAVERDSNVANEYWVFDPTYKASSNNDIGFLHTGALNNL